MLLINVLADLIHLIKIIVLCDVFFAFHRRKIEYRKILLLIVSVAMCGTSAFIHLYNNDLVETFVYIGALVLMIFLLYKEKILSIFFMVVWSVMALAMLDTMSAVLFDVSVDLLGIDGMFVKNLCVSAISLVVVWIVGRLYKKNTTEGMHSVGKVNLFLYTLLLFADMSVVAVIAYMISGFEINKHRNVYLVAVIFVIIGIFIQLAAVILLFYQRNVYKEKEAITDKYLSEQKSHYEYLENREKETKKFRHDLRSHMEIISSMANNHDFERMNKYLEKMHIKIDTFGNLVTVQNGIVDAIINQYYTKAGQNDIKMEVKGRLPVDCAIDAYDLCTIFSNILSNAFEAAIATEEKYISLECRYNDKNIIIAVKNSFDGSPQSGNTQWKTRKEDTDYHGYGLENVKDSIKRYNGMFDIEAKDGMFILTILFNNTH